MNIELIVKLGVVAFFSIWFLAYYKEADPKGKEGFWVGVGYGALCAIILFV